MTLGMILLLAAGVLLLLGIGQRVVDRMRLKDWQALLAIALIVGLGFVPDVTIGRFSFNIGGFVIPLALSVYVFIRAEGWEKLRCLASTVLSAAAIYLMGRYLPDEPEEILIDATYLYGVAAGILTWILSRSRRGAFIAGAVGVMAAQTFTWLLVTAGGTEQTLNLGGAGGYDTIIIASLVSVLTSELLGEIVERITRGAKGEKATK